MLNEKRALPVSVF